MDRRTIAYKDSTISYMCFGTGNQAVICFHGYGEEGSAFGFMELDGGKHFRFYAIDLPFHGSTAWKEGLLFSVADLTTIIQLLVKREQIGTPLRLMGFSLGARIALSYYQEVPEGIRRLVLLAPDGLKVNFWYWWVTQTWFGNELFHFTMKHPGWFFILLKLLNKLGMVNTSIFKFVKYYIGNSEVREQLYERWTSLRRLKPNLGKISALLEEYKADLQLVYGRHDRIIRPSTGKRYQQKLGEQATLTIIDSGHQVLQEKHGRIITALLADPTQ